jgi:hypothetical protein
MWSPVVSSKKWASAQGRISARLRRGGVEVKQRQTVCAV